MQNWELKFEVGTLSKSVLSRIFNATVTSEIDTHYKAFVAWAEIQPDDSEWETWMDAIADYLIGDHMTKIVTDIALKHYQHPLQRRNQDRLDFHEVACWTMEEALREAVLAGFKFIIEPPIQNT